MAVVALVAPLRPVPRYNAARPFARLAVRLSSHCSRTTSNGPVSTTARNSVRTYSSTPMLSDRDAPFRTPIYLKHSRCFASVLPILSIALPDSRTCDLPTFPRNRFIPMQSPVYALRSRPPDSKHNGLRIDETKWRLFQKHRSPLLFMTTLRTSVRPWSGRGL